MDVREKLVELIKKFVPTVWYEDCDEIRHEKCDEIHCSECIAERLIAHGVTVQEEAKLYWKPVKPGEWNLTCSACGSHLGCKENANFCPECGAKFVYPKAVAPQPPKGE